MSGRSLFVEFAFQPPSGDGVVERWEDRTTNQARPVVHGLRVFVAGLMLYGLRVFVAGLTSHCLPTFVALDLVQDLGWPVGWFPVLVFARVVAPCG